MEENKNPTPVAEEVGKKEREQTTIRFPKELKEELQKEADRKGISFNDYLMWLIDKARVTQNQV